MKNILALRFSALGDVAMTVPVLQCVVRQNPQVEKIRMVSRPFFAPVFRGLERVEFTGKDIDKSYRSLSGLRRLSAELHTLHPDADAVADLHDVLRTKVIRTFLRLYGHRVAVIDKGRQEKRRLVRRGALASQPLRSTHERYADVFRRLGLKVDLSAFEPIRLPLSDEVETFLRLFRGQKILGIAPLAKHPGKQYPTGGTREVIRLILAERPETVVFLFGAPSEKKLLDTLVVDLKRVFNLAGLFDLGKELEIISRLDLMWAMDSGNGHLAANYGVPVFTTWGVTHPYAGFAPLGQTDDYRILPDLHKFPKLPCSVYGNKICPGYEKIWDDLTPEIVAEKILEVFP